MRSISKTHVVETVVTLLALVSRVPSVGVLLLVFLTESLRVAWDTAHNPVAMLSTTRKLI